MSIGSASSVHVPRRRGRPSAKPAGATPEVPELLLSAAITQFAAHGFEGVGTRQIAAHAGVDAAMIAHHFGSKLQLWQAAIDQLSRQLLQAMEQTTENTPDGFGAAARLDQATGQIVDVLCDASALSAFILREVVLENDRSEYSYERLIKPIHNRLRPLIVDFAAQQESDVDADYLFVSLTGALVSAVAARRLFGRMSARPQNDIEFREVLKSTVSAQISARVGTAPGAS